MRDSPAPADPRRIFREPPSPSKLRCSRGSCARVREAAAPLGCQAVAGVRSGAFVGSRRAIAISVPVMVGTYDAYADTAAVGRLTV